LLAIALNVTEEGEEEKGGARPFGAPIVSQGKQGKRAVPLRETDLRVVRLMAW